LSLVPAVTGRGRAARKIAFISSRIGHGRGRPVLLGAGNNGAMIARGATSGRTEGDYQKEIGHLVASVWGCKRHETSSPTISASGRGDAGTAIVCPWASGRIGRRHRPGGNCLASWRWYSTRAIDPEKRRALKTFWRKRSGIERGGTAIVHRALMRYGGFCV
jgi:hypothetical protein